MSDVDTRTASLKSPINVAEYLFRRLHQVGVRNVFGVPGDYSLVVSSGFSWLECDQKTDAQSSSHLTT